MDSKRAIPSEGPKLSDALLQLNDLKYQLPAEIGVAVSKTIVVDNSQESSYSTSRTIIFDSQTGSNFVCGPESWLEFNVVVTNASGTTDWGQGSAMNVFNQVLVKARGGQEISRVERANLYAKTKDSWEKPSSWFNSVGGVMGYGVTDHASALTFPATNDPESSRRYCIPLSCLSPLFAQKRLLPPQMMEGMRIELLIEALATMVSCTTAAASAFSITTPEIHWSVVRLADQYARAINNLASGRGLNLLHSEPFHQSTSANSTQYNFDVRKAAAKALKLIVIPRITADSTDAEKDSMASDLFDTVKFQAHIGADYFPQQAITGAGTIATSGSSYYHSLHGFDKLEEPQNPPLVSYVSFSAQSEASRWCHCVKLNKSGVNDLDGVQTNNSRACVVALTTNNSVGRTLDVYLEHARLLTVFNSGTVIRD